MMSRIKCVICENKLTHIYTHNNQPITYCPKLLDNTKDQFQDLHYGACNKCGSVQLLTLIDPEILYADPHNITYNTPTWAEHHKAFADFLRVHLPAKIPIFEVGGSSGILASQLLENYSDYTIMDFCHSESIPEGVNFIRGNCETHNFSGVKSVVMSHLFEHLYEPHRFIGQIAAAGVAFAAISIPNMSELLKVNSPAVVHAEHTYFLEAADAAYMFSCHGYRLLGQMQFKKHSIFMIFQHDPNSEKIDHIFDTSRAQAILATFRKRDERFSAVELSDGALIVPAGIYGQIIYTHTKHAGSVAGFLDNDPSKQGRRLYGTNSIIYSFDKLINMKEPVIYIHAGPYTEEIKRQIYSLRSDANVYIL